MDLQKYFYTDYEFYLDQVHYNKKPSSNINITYQLKCTDEITASLSDDNTSLTLLISRSLVFEPNEVFSLYVSFGAILKFKEDTLDEVDWSKVNLSEEFKENGGFVTTNLSNRISTLIANITSSFGQPPILLPPAFVSSKQK